MERDVIAKIAYDLGWSYRVSEKVLTLDDAITLNPYQNQYDEIGNIRFQFFNLGFKVACDYLELQRSFGIQLLNIPFDPYSKLL